MWKLCLCVCNVLSDKKSVKETVLKIFIQSMFFYCHHRTSKLQVIFVLWKKKMQTFLFLALHLLSVCTNCGLMWLFVRWNYKHVYYEIEKFRCLWGKKKKTDLTNSNHDGCYMKLHFWIWKKFCSEKKMFQNEDWKRSISNFYMKSSETGDHCLLSAGVFRVSSPFLLSLAFIDDVCVHYLLSSYLEQTHQLLFCSPSSCQLLQYRVCNFKQINHTGKFSYFLF